MKTFITRIIILTLATLSVITSQAADIDIPTIPDSLANGANSVVLGDYTTVNVISLSEATISHYRSVLVFNKKGEKHANFGATIDKYTSIKKLTGTLYDSNGNAIRQIGKKDLRTTELSPYLASDEASCTHSFDHPTYPYTVIYEWETSISGYLITFPSFVPIHYDSQSLLENEYKIHLPTSMKLNYKVRNTVPVISNEEASGWNTYTFRIPKTPAIKDDSYLPNTNEIVPLIHLNPGVFEVSGIRGYSDSWKNIGIWLTKLMEGRDQLLPEDVNSLKALTAQYPTPREKAKAVYELLRNTTRYVNISLGIGGLRPEKASDVKARGFGDCKALSNYMCAMLKALDIPCDYAVISTEHKNVLHDFASLGQFNHAIMRVTLPGDTIWLECTDPTLPFGYIHDGIAGHEALIVDGENSHIVRLPIPKHETQKREYKYYVEFTTDGCGYSHIEENYSENYFEKNRTLKEITRQETQDNIREKTGLSTALVVDFKYVENLSNQNVCSYIYTIFAPKFCKQSEKRMYIPTNLFKTDISKYTDYQRILPIVITDKHEVYDITIRIPSGYKLESLPSNVEVSSPIGQFTQTTAVTDDLIHITQTIKIPSGEYDASLSPQLAELTQAIYDNMNALIVLVK